MPGPNDGIDILELLRLLQRFLTPIPPQFQYGGPHKMQDQERVIPPVGQYSGSAAPELDLGEILRSAMQDPMDTSGGMPGIYAWPPNTRFDGYPPDIFPASPGDWSGDPFSNPSIMPDPMMQTDSAQMEILRRLLGGRSF